MKNCSCRTVNTEIAGEYSFFFLYYRSTIKTRCVGRVGAKGAPSPRVEKIRMERANSVDKMRTYEKNQT